jgi:hypothetical protein
MERSKSDLNIGWVANPASCLTFSGVFSLSCGQYRNPVLKSQSINLLSSQVVDNQ